MVGRRLKRKRICVYIYVCIYIICIYIICMYIICIYIYS